MAGALQPNVPPRCLVKRFFSLTHPYVHVCTYGDGTDYVTNTGGLYSMRIDNNTVWYALLAACTLTMIHAWHNMRVLTGL